MARCYSITAASLVSRASCKRLASRYTGGPSRNWVKSKCPGWKRINSERYRLFEGPRKTELTEAQRTLARKREQLRQGHRAPAVTAAKPRHRSRAEKDHGHADRKGKQFEFRGYVYESFSSAPTSIFVIGMKQWGLGPVVIALGAFGQPWSKFSTTLTSCPAGAGFGTTLSRSHSALPSPSVSPKSSTAADRSG
jgi:hypothetical protein